MGTTPWRLVVAVAAIIMVLLALVDVEANSAAAGSNPDTIGRTLTVEETEDRAAMLWALVTAGRWMEEDRMGCDKRFNHPATYARCLVVRSNTRFLYMLRRNCVGVSAIADACKMEEVK